MRLHLASQSITGSDKLIWRERREPNTVLPTIINMPPRWIMPLGRRQRIPQVCSVSGDFSFAEFTFVTLVRDQGFYKGKVISLVMALTGWRHHNMSKELHYQFSSSLSDSQQLFHTAFNTWSFLKMSCSNTMAPNSEFGCTARTFHYSRPTGENICLSTITFWDSLLWPRNFVTGMFRKPR